MYLKFKARCKKRSLEIRNLRLFQIKKCPRITTVECSLFSGSKIFHETDPLRFANGFI